jgi:NitT/TauT family transport system ATP-binding protein
MEAKKSKITVRKISRSFVSADGSKVDALENINFEIEDAYSREGRDIGEFRVLLGPSGCGKSTLLRLIAGLDTADTGEILVNEQPVHGPGKDRGMVFQKYTSFPWLTVAGNIAYGLKINGVPEKQCKETVAQLVKDIGLSGFENAYPETLSGGMQQRVAIARALTVEPSILLMDEPFGALDALSREKAQKDLLDVLSKDRERSILFVTHSIDEAVFLSNTVVVFTPRPGRTRKIFQVDLGDERRRADKGIRTEADFTKCCADVRQSLIEEQVL